MNTKIYLFIFLIIMVVFTACEKSGTTDVKNEDHSALLSDYAYNTIIATYSDMKNNARQLYVDVVKLQDTLSQDNIDAACLGWKNTRAPWEMSEAFLFGPVAYNGLDPLLDSWPLDQAQLDQVLSGSQELTPDFVRDGLGAVLRGFHTIEYLLFRNGENRNVADFTQREVDYLVAVTQVLRDDCITLWALWNGVEPGSFEENVMDGLGIDVSDPYVNEFLNAGKAGSRYTTQQDALDEIIQGILDIADEVANGKLADPYTTKDVLTVESWHSWNSLTDFKNNIRSIEHAYTSTDGTNSAHESISKLVSKTDEDLDLRTKAAIQDAIDALDKIGEPYRNNLDDDIPIQEAMTAINKIYEIFSKEVKPAILG